MHKRIQSGSGKRADKAQEFTDILKNFTQERAAAIQDPETGQEFAFDMFLTELYNTEYGYTGDPTEAIEHLGYALQEIGTEPVLKAAFEKACKRILPD